MVWSDAGDVWEAPPPPLGEQGFYAQKGGNFRHFPEKKARHYALLVKLCYLWGENPGKRYY